jgi:hypothetical protein
MRKGKARVSLAWMTLAALWVASGLAANLCRAQILETETAHLIPAGALEVNGAFERQSSSEGTESAVPLAVGYGLSSRFELLVEPVARTVISPKQGRSASGVGDVEVTLTYLLRRDTGGGPAFAVAAEAKAPTARNRLIGTGKADYAGYLIASETFGRLTLHGNLVYTFVGKPAGVDLSNTYGGAVAAEYQLNPRFELFGEILASSASTPNAEGGDGTPTIPGSTFTPEAAGSEIIGTLGAGTYVAHRAFLSLSLSYDNRQALLIRPGFTLRFR